MQQVVQIVAVYMCFEKFHLFVLIVATKSSSLVLASSTTTAVDGEEGCRRPMETIL